LVWVPPTFRGWCFLVSGMPTAGSADRRWTSAGAKEQKRSSFLDG